MEKRKISVLHWQGKVKMKKIPPVSGTAAATESCTRLEAPSKRSHKIKSFLLSPPPSPHEAPPLKSQISFKNKNPLCSSNSFSNNWRIFQPGSSPAKRRPGPVANLAS